MARGTFAATRESRAMAGVGAGQPLAIALLTTQVEAGVVRVVVSCSEVFRCARMRKSGTRSLTTYRIIDVHVDVNMIRQPCRLYPP